MAGNGTLATTAIITKGLTCGHGPLDPCKHGLITTPFSLYCTGIIPPPKPSGGGGPYPYDAWNKFNSGDIKNFYKPVSIDDYYIIPRDQEERYFRRYKLIKITLKIGDFISEKEYSVPDNRAKAVFKVFNFINATKDRIDIVVNNIKRLTTEAVVKIKNLRMKK